LLGGQRAHETRRRKLSAGIKELLSGEKRRSNLPMSDIDRDNRIEYVELGASDLELVKNFYVGVFGWSFTDYGPDYTSFEAGSVGGGFTRDIAPGGSPLVIIYAGDLEAKYEQVKTGGGQITKEIFSFPGGRRFQFRDPGGNELGVWSDK
jgi:predicted enzyme related to lactoylglutathione lyase